MHVIIINGSPRTCHLSNTTKILQAFIKGYEAEGNTCELYSLSKLTEWQAARNAYQQNQKIIFALPMYVESIPSLMLEFLATLPTERQLPAELSFIVHGGFDEGYQFRLCERLLMSITTQLGCDYGGCLIKGGSFMLRLLGDDEVEKLTSPYLEMGRSYATNGDFLTPAARKFTGTERYPLPVRLLCSLIFRLIVNRKFEQVAQDWGCETRLDVKPFEIKN